MPSVFWVVGGIDPEVFAAAEKAGKTDELPANHAPDFAPVIDPTLRIGVEAMLAAAGVWLVGEERRPDQGRLAPRQTRRKPTSRSVSATIGSAIAAARSAPARSTRVDRGRVGEQAACLVGDRAQLLDEQRRPAPP